jgi:hypothetical protein
MTWAQKIKSLDNNRCAFCGSQVKKEAHHIVYRRNSADLVNDLNNGITLCHKCHYAAHYGHYAEYGCSMRPPEVSPQDVNTFIQDYVDRVRRNYALRNFDYFAINIVAWIPYHRDFEA